MTSTTADRPEPKGGRKADPTPGVRRCLATGRSLPKERLVRFVAGPDGTVAPDLDETLPGRGAWVVAERAAIERAARRGLGALGRVPDDLADRVERLLVVRCRDMIGLARRAGQAVVGFESTRAALTGGQVAVLIEARDAAPDGRARLARLGAARTPGLAVAAVLDREEIGQALGRDQAVHAALATGRLADRFLREARRLAGLRPGAEMRGGSDSTDVQETVRR